MRKVTYLKDNWHFLRTKEEDLYKESVEMKDYQTVSIPHDYAIEGPFDRENDRQVIEVIADGILTPKEQTGRTGGLPHTEWAWYRKMFTVSPSSGCVMLEFDGVMNNSIVFVNGKRVGARHYGYSSFCYEITDYIRRDKENLLAVWVRPEGYASRWYPGAGIYRKVRLVEKDTISVAYNGTAITSQLEGNVATITHQTVLDKKDEEREVTLITQIINPEGECIQEDKTTSVFSKMVQTFEINTPKLWDIETPNLYQSCVSVLVEGVVVDQYVSTFGIRTIRFDKETGFYLNGRALKLNGVCEHHDFGALGAAYHTSAMRRKISKLKAMGTNALRTTHNPADPDVLVLCDEMGMLVIEEAFDEWRYAKVTNGYHKYFDACAKQDLTDMIIRDRNHPSIIMWSIGNEIIDQHHKDGAATAAFLSKICHDLDTTRPTTAGFNNPDGAIPNGLCDAVDIVGFNYKPHRYEAFHKEHPEWIIYGSETSSCTSSRGEYYFPAQLEKPPILRETLHCTSFDLTGPIWAYPPDVEFEAQDNYAFSLGEFVWTGFDYLGEPTPYIKEWPSRSAYFGIIDLCGIPKDRYYAYQAQWTKEPVLHLMPHWNWEEKQCVDVQCYTNLGPIELFLNGKSLGVRQKEATDTYTKYRLMWKGITYTAGTLRAVSLEHPEHSCEIKTAQKPFALRLTPEVKSLSMAKEDLGFVRCDIVDEVGVICPLADHRVEISVEGVGHYIASDAGDQTSIRRFSETYCEAFHGSLMIFVKPDAVGSLKVSVTSEGLMTTHCELEVIL